MNDEKLTPDPYLLPALEQATEALRARKLADLEESRIFYGPVPEGKEAVRLDAKTGERLPDPLSEEEIEICYENALFSLGQLMKIIPAAADWQSQRNLMTMVLFNGLRSVISKGAPVYGFELVIEALGNASEQHVALSEDKPHLLPARKSARPGDGRHEDESLFEVPLIYADRALTTYDALCDMVVAMQRDAGVPLEDCEVNVYQYALKRFLDRHPDGHALHELDVAQVEEVAAEAGEIMVEMFEPYHNDTPYTLFPEIAWFVQQAARELADDINEDGQLVPPNEAINSASDAANDNGRHFVDIAYSPAVARRVRSMVAPIMVEYADMADNMHRLTAAMDRCEQYFDERQNLQREGAR